VFCLCADNKAVTSLYGSIGDDGVNLQNFSQQWGKYGCTIFCSRYFYIVPKSEI